MLQKGRITVREKYKEYEILHSHFPCHVPISTRSNLENYLAKFNYGPIRTKMTLEATMYNVIEVKKSGKWVLTNCFRFKGEPGAAVNKIR